MALIPKDLMEQLKASGVKFDENGNIIEDPDEKFIVDPEDDEDDDDLDDQDDDLDEDDDDEGDDEDDDEDADDDEEEDEEPVRKKTTRSRKKKEQDESNEDDEKPLLTPRTPQQEKETDDDIAEIRKNINKLLAKSELAKDEDEDDEEESDDLKLRNSLRTEIADVQRMKLQFFADNLKSRVNAMNLGADFKTIIESTQWEEYLQVKAYGKRIGDLYRDSIKAHDAEVAAFFFDDFASRYLAPKKKAKEEVPPVKQKNLDDLAVPDRTKANKAPSKRSKYDFEENDYSKMLDKAERGVISRKEFVEFDDKFHTALEKGRVKPSR